MCTELAEHVVGQLAARGQKLSLAESCTGGRVAAAITGIAGASEVFVGGVVAYSNAAKAQLLAVDWATIDTHGAVSEQTAHEMAVNTQVVFRTDYAIAVTGIAGPTGGSKEKPVGLVYLGIATPDGVGTIQLQLSGERGEIQRQATARALEALLERM